MFFMFKYTFVMLGSSSFDYYSKNLSLLNFLVNSKILLVNSSFGNIVRCSSLVVIYPAALNCVLEERVT